MLTKANKVLSVIVTIFYCVLCLIWFEIDVIMLFLLGYLVLPLACIWLADIIGEFTGIGSRGIFISSPTPGIFINIMGWILLLLPIVAVLIMF
jgi:hypothetical protein